MVGATGPEERQRTREQHNEQPYSNNRSARHSSMTISQCSPPAGREARMTWRRSSAWLAAVSAADLLSAMKELASICPLSRSLMTVGFLAMKLCVATSSVVTNWPFGHRLASLTSA